MRKPYAIYNKADSPTSCPYCGRPSYCGRVFCDPCWEIVTVCRYTLRELVRERYMEQIAPNAWLIKPGAQEIVQLIYEAVERFTERAA